MSKLEFREEDFLEYAGGGHFEPPTSAGRLAAMANARLEEMLRECPEAIVTITRGGFFGPMNTETPGTTRVRLVSVERIDGKSPEQADWERRHPGGAMCKHPYCRCKD